MKKFKTIRRNALDILRAQDSYTFLMKELEKVDEKILEPLTGTDWPRDMPVITGGGLSESIVSVDVTYGSTGRDQNNLIFDATNDIPVVQADMSQSIARCFNFAEYMVFNVLEKEKMMSVGRDPETFLNKGIRLHCDKVIDQNVYTGFTKVSSTGLVNNPRIMRVSSPATGTGNSSKWADKTADQIPDPGRHQHADCRGVEGMRLLFGCAAESYPGAGGAVRAAGDAEGERRFRAEHPDLCAGEQPDEPAGRAPGDFAVQMAERGGEQLQRPDGLLYQRSGEDLLQPDAAAAADGDGIRGYAGEDSFRGAVFGGTVSLYADGTVYGWGVTLFPLTPFPLSGERGNKERDGATPHPLTPTQQE